MSGTSSSPINTSRAPAVVQTTANEMTKNAVIKRSDLLETLPTILQSTSELLELSTGPNAQVLHEDVTYTRVPLDSDEDELIQKLPKRKRTGNGWTRNKKGTKTAATEKPSTPVVVAVAVEVDPSKEEWATNLKRVVFQPSTIATKSGTSAQKPSVAASTQSPAHVMHFPRAPVVDKDKDCETRGNTNANHSTAVTGSFHGAAHL